MVLWVRLFKQTKILIRDYILGKHIHLLDRKWAVAVEQAMGNIMTGYLCSCREDERVLLEILSRCVPAHDMDYRPSVTGNKSSFFSYTKFILQNLIVMKYQSKIYDNLRVNLIFFIKLK